MNKIINGVASEYDMPMKYENKKTTIFIDTQDMEERYAEGLYMDYLKEENQQLKDNWNKLKEWLEEETIQHWNTTILGKMQELEKGNEVNE